jgi:hypothetical protein
MDALDISDNVPWHAVTPTVSRYFPPSSFLTSGAGFGVGWCAVVRGGLAVVICPLISLMQDQVKSFQSKGISAEYLCSSRTSEEKRQVRPSHSRDPTSQNTDYLTLYVADARGGCHLQIYTSLDSGKLNLLYVTPEGAVISRLRPCTCFCASNATGQLSGRHG